MARQACDQRSWILGAPHKTRLFQLWFQTAAQESGALTCRELEAQIGAKGPNALRRTLPRLIEIGLVAQIEDTYQPLPYSSLPAHLRELRDALEQLLAALGKL